jgi:hypothetical protein
MKEIRVQVGPNAFAPISTRPLVPQHMRHAGIPDGARYGDIISRPQTSFPLVIVSPHQLDDGSGQRSFTYQRDPNYKIIGSVYESTELLLPLLALPH